MSTSNKAEERTGFLFAEAHLAEQKQQVLELLGPALRVVHWSADIRPCLVRCEAGERNIRRIRELTTLCGFNCKDAKGTTAKPPHDNEYCNACLALAGNGVLR
jgi:hypothetical protein